MKSKYNAELDELAYTMASHRCDATAPYEVVKELADIIKKTELTDWDVAEDDHELWGEQR